ncbi:hypothetical protein CPB84DRAFT_1764645 [Gymnopilus junonius]|uniref:Uncharacterized protein n=1 Tax=Gymnopilus junonius TaxID=109634 RepID=A0A9P5TS73_GYMJU|nr:hypothetical protein CPB84DRAFT_1764645 [Gymnopilus junonius]
MIQQQGRITLQNTNIGLHHFAYTDQKLPAESKTSQCAEVEIYILESKPENSRAKRKLGSLDNENNNAHYKPPLFSLFETKTGSADKRAIEPFHLSLRKYEKLVGFKALTWTQSTGISQRQNGGIYGSIQELAWTMSRGKTGRASKRLAPSTSSDDENFPSSKGMYWDNRSERRI